MDGPSAQGFLSLTGPLAPRVADCRSAAMLIKSALRDLLLVSYGKITILVISRCAAPPYPAAPDFPPSGGQNKSLYAFLQRHGSMAKHAWCPLEEGERWWRQPPKRGTPEWYMKYMTRLFFSPYLSFPLEGKSREAGKGVRGRAPIGCSIAVLTANRRSLERSDAQNVVSRFPFRGNEYYNAAFRRSRPHRAS